MPKTTQMVQASHAACEAGIRLISPEIDHPNFVLLGVANEADLIKQFESIKQKGFPVVIFREEDLGNSVTALASGPIYGEDRKFFRNLNLIREN